MPLPATSLMVAPADLDDTFGVGMAHTDLIRGLRRCNPSLTIPDPSTWEGWYPGRASGMTSIWLGQPPAAMKICAFHLGMIPEFTQAAPDQILRRGWRDIFARVIKAGVASQETLEREFKISLETSGPDLAHCRRCQLDGIQTLSDRDGLCTSHSQLHSLTEHNEMLARERRLKSSW